MSEEVIDLSKPRIAYRAWQTNGRYLLSSYVLDFQNEDNVKQEAATWLPFAEKEAICAKANKKSRQHGLVPSKDCGCGFYGFHSLSDLLQIRNKCFVIGRIAIWGRIWEHDFGYRSQYAYPQMLYIWPDKRANKYVNIVINQLAANYGVESAPFPNDIKTFELIGKYMGLEAEQYENRARTYVWKQWLNNKFNLHLKNIIKT